MSAFEWTLQWAHQANAAGQEKLRLRSFTEIDSTNRFAKDDDFSQDESLKPGANVSRPTLYLADRQTQGRGRGVNKWNAKPGMGLLSSWSFHVSRAPQPVLAPLVGLALFESAHATWPALAFNLKAPNDLFIDDKKVAGILIETVATGAKIKVVAGVGLNVGFSPAEITTAVSLTSALRREPTRKEWFDFLSLWLERLSTALKEGQDEELTLNARERLCDALNLHPLLTEPVLEVDARGQIRSASRVIYWHEL